MRSPGVYISAVGHAGLLVWLIAGWGLSADPLPFEVTEFSVVSGEEFAALTTRSTPNPSTAEPDAPVAPEVVDTPTPPDQTDQAEPREDPVVVEPPADETPPPEAPEPIAPPSEVEDTPPDVAPPAVEEQPAIPEPVTDNPPQARPAPRVADEPIQAPEPDVQVDDTAEPAVAPDPDAQTTEPEPEQETAAPETSTEIVTEPEEPSGAVETSMRPTARPNRPAPEPAPEPQTTSNDDVNSALAEALAGAEPDIPQGPPMTGSERDNFRIAVNRCWNVDPGSVAARVTIVVGFSLTQEGKIDGDIRQVSASGGDASAQRTAFQAARRAIMRCGSSGYDLPAEKYGQWKDVEIEFDPSGMRLR